MRHSIVLRDSFLKYCCYEMPINQNLCSFAIGTAEVKSLLMMLPSSIIVSSVQEWYDRRWRFHVKHSVGLFCFIGFPTIIFCDPCDLWQIAGCMVLIRMKHTRSYWVTRIPCGLPSSSRNVVPQTIAAESSVSTGLILQYLNFPGALIERYYIHRINSSTLKLSWSLVGGFVSKDRFYNALWCFDVPPGMFYR